MSLQFPNARLLIHNLLAVEHLSGAEAIARGAREYGLTSCDPSDAEDTDMKKAITDCDCCEAAHCVLRKYFRSKATDGQITEAAWKSMMRQLAKYRGSHQQVEAKENEPDCQGTCAKLAPVIFDLLLQEVRRYA